jgi:hypothetical protein
MPRRPLFTSIHPQIFRGELPKFPVFYPVCREIRLRTVRWRLPPPPESFKVNSLGLRPPALLPNFKAYSTSFWSRNSTSLTTSSYPAQGMQTMNSGGKYQWLPCQAFTTCPHLWEPLGQLESSRSGESPSSMRAIPVVDENRNFLH